MLTRGTATAHGTTAPGSVARPFPFRARTDPTRNGLAQVLVRRHRVPPAGSALLAVRPPAVPCRGIKEGDALRWGVRQSHPRPPPPTPPLISAHQTPALPHRQQQAHAATRANLPCPSPPPVKPASAASRQRRPAEQDAAPGAPWTPIRICCRPMSPYQTRKHG